MWRACKAPSRVRSLVKARRIDGVIALGTSHLRLFSYSNSICTAFSTSLAKFDKLSSLAPVSLGKFDTFTKRSPKDGRW